MTASYISTPDFSFKPREVPAFLALAKKNEEVYKDKRKDPAVEARLKSLRLHGDKVTHSIAAVSTDPALVMVIVTIQGTEECLIAFDIKTGRLLKTAVHFPNSPKEWEGGMCLMEPNILARQFGSEMA